MTDPTPGIGEQLRQQVADILGVETDLHGTPEQYLIRGESGRVEQGIDFSPEIDYLLALIDKEADRRAEQQVREFAEELKNTTMMAGLRPADEFVLSVGAVDNALTAYTKGRNTDGK